MRQKLMKKKKSKEKKQQKKSSNTNTNTSSNTNNSNNNHNDNYHDDNSNKSLKKSNNKSKSQKQNKRNRNRKRNKNNHNQGNNNHNNHNNNNQNNNNQNNQNNGNKNNKKQNHRRRKRKRNSNAITPSPAPSKSTVNSNRNQQQTPSQNQPKPRSLPASIHIIDDDQESISIPMDSAESDLSGIFQQIHDTISSDNLAQSLPIPQSPQKSQDTKQDEEDHDNNNDNNVNTKSLPTSLDEIFQTQILEPMMRNKLALEAKGFSVPDVSSIWRGSRFSKSDNMHDKHSSNHSNASKEDIHHNNNNDVAMEKSMDNPLPASDESLHNEDQDKDGTTNRPSTNHKDDINGKKGKSDCIQTAVIELQGLQGMDKNDMIRIIKQQNEEINELKRNMNTLSKMVFGIKDNLEDIQYNIEEKDDIDPTNDINDLRHEMIVIKKRLNLLENEKTDREQFKDWLKNTVKLDEYFHVFIENGFEDMISISKLTKDMLNQIGITKIGHQQRLLHFVDLIKDNVQPYQY